MSTVYQKDELNRETGEVSTLVKITSSKTEETFVFMRTTGKMEWLNGFGVSIEFKVFAFMVDLQNTKTGITDLNKRLTEEIAISLNCNLKSITNSISRLVKDGHVIRLQRGSYICNPNNLYKGDSGNVKKRILEWNKLKGIEIIETGVL